MKLISYKVILLFAALLLLGTPACRVVESTEIGSASATPDGVPYLLPMGKIRISVVVTGGVGSAAPGAGGGSDAGDDGAGGTGAAGDDSHGATGNGATQFATVPNVPTGPAPSDAGGGLPATPSGGTNPVISSTINGNGPTSTTNTTTANPRDPKLPAGAVAPKRKASASTAASAASGYQINYVDTLYYPDARFQYVAHYRPSILSDDTVDIVVRKDGLLSKVDVTTKDQSGAIILKIAQLAKKLGVTFAAGTGSGSNTIYDATFDPLDPVACRHIKHDLAGLKGGPYSFEMIDRSPRDLKATVSTLPQPPRVFSGVAFRPVLAYDLVLKRQGKTTSIQTVLLPNEATVLSFPVTRSAFVTKSTTLTFDGGILTEAKIVKPSEALAFMDIPLGIVDALLAVPTDAINNVTGKSAAKSGDLTNAANSQAAQAAYKQQLNDAVTTAAPKSPPIGGVPVQTVSLQ